MGPSGIKMATFRCMSSVRQFSSSAIKAALVKPPIQVFGTEGRYATALYSAASKKSQLDKVEKELSSLQAELKKNVALMEYLIDPTQNKAEKKAAVEQLMKQKKVSELVVNLFGALAENGRINKTAGVLSAFEKIMSAHRGEVKATLQGFLAKGETLQLTTEVDPTIIGGMKITIGDRFVDMSMASKIKTYTDLIKLSV